MAETLSKQSIIWTGRGISMLVVLALLADAAVSLLAPEKIAGEVIAMGFKVSQSPVVGTIIRLALGALTWGGIYLRDARLRAFVPLTMSMTELAK